MADKPRIIDTPQWQALAAHHEQVKDLHLRDLFAADPTRGETLTAEAGDLYLDTTDGGVYGLS